MNRKKNRAKDSGCKSAKGGLLGRAICSLKGRKKKVDTKSGY